jgi:diguanylate cyclase (GGDEF)-like protein/PAS domain S-box-containing protein
MVSCVRAEDLLAAILSSTEDALLSFTLDGIVQTWSRGAELLYGYREAEIVSQPLARLLPSNDARKFDGLLHAAIQGEFPQCEKTERLHKDGSSIFLAVSRAPIRNEHGDIMGIVETAKTSALSSIETVDDGHLKEILEQVPVVLWTTNLHLRVTSCLGAGFRGMKSRSDEMIVGKSIYEYLKCRDPHTTPIPQHFDALRGVSSQFEYKRNHRVLELHLEPLRSKSGDIIGCIGAGMDITERKKTEEKVRYQATHDALTGLANYREFLDTLEREIRRGERSKRSFAVLLLDLDALKSVNDRLGHLAGNRALKRLSEVMKEQCRSTDLAARYGGDEFAVLLIDADPGVARQIAGRVQIALRNGPEHPPLSVSIGVSVYPDDGRSAQDLLEAADRELYQRKRALRGRSVAARAR